MFGLSNLLETKFMKYILQSYLYLITDLLLILIHDNYADKENEDPALVQCRPKEANRISQRSQYQVTESPSIIVTAATADTESPKYIQQAMQQKDFDRKLEVVEKEISKYMSSTDSSSGGEKKSKVTRELSVRFYMRSICIHVTYTLFVT